MILKLILIVAVLGLAFYGFISFQEDIENDEIKIYQGPIPLGADLDHFRKTGKTIMVGESNG